MAMVRTQAGKGPGTLRGHLRAELQNLAPAQRRLAAFLLGNLSTASDYTITDLAGAAGVSVGTISQLCRRLGLKGYQDLRLLLAREAVFLEAAESAGGRIALPEDAPAHVASVVRRVFGGNREALAETAARLDLHGLDAAVDLLLGAQRIECVGVGTAGLVAQEAALKLRKLGLDAIAQADAHVQAMSAGLLGTEDVLLAISHSGRTIDTLRCAQLARAGGARVVVITGQGHTPLADAGDILLSTVSTDTGFQVEPMASTITALSVVQVLFIAILERARTQAEERLARTQAAVEDRHITGRSW